jgi:hypothetical protein
MAPVTPAQRPFIVSLSLDKQDAATRSFIRSHVMRGKNDRKARRERKSQKTHPPNAAKSPHIINDAQSMVVPLLPTHVILRDGLRRLFEVGMTPFKLEIVHEGECTDITFPCMMICLLTCDA